MKLPALGMFQASEYSLPFSDYVLVLLNGSAVIYFLVGQLLAQQFFLIGYELAELLFSLL